MLFDQSVDDFAISQWRCI